MNAPQKTILYVAVVVLVLMVLFPPFFGVDRTSAGRVHAFIGYHPIWSPPTPAQVYRSLTGGDPAGVDAERLAAFVARPNAVRLLFNSLWLAAAAVLGLVLSRRRERKV